MTIRSTGGRVGAYAWLVFAALNLADLAFGVTGDVHYGVTSGSVAVLLLLGCGIAYVLGLRPAIVGDEDGVTVRNPLREARVPWRAVREIEGTHVLTVRFAGPDGAELRTRAWVHQTSPRAQAKAEARARRDAAGGAAGKAAAARVKGRTPAAFAAQRLNEMRERQRAQVRSGAPDKAAAARAEQDAPATGTVAWSLTAIAALAVPLVALAGFAVAAAAG